MKFYIEVYGCTANKSDANLLKGIITKHPQHQLVTDSNDADVLIILTCTVIDTTEQRMLHRIKKLSTMQKKLVIAGCMASVQQKMLKKKFPNALFLSPREITFLFKILNHNTPEESVKEKANTSLSSFHTGLIAPIAIAEGCLFSCSYCITHLARGLLYSYPEKRIISSVKNAIYSGCKEIQLTAQDTASYGLDNDSSLSHLLHKIHLIPGDYMIRVGMMNPRSVKPILSDLIKAYDHNHIYSFIHLPIQSGDNDILYEMNRGYTVNDIQSIINQIKKTFPTMTIATDVIVGFPSETQDQFNKTMQVLEYINPDIVNITRFSARPFTKAKKMHGRLPTETVKERSKKLTRFCQKLTLKQNERYKGKTMQVLTLKKGKNDSTIARSKNYKPVIIPKQLHLGERHLVEIKDVSSIHLVGILK